MKKRLSIFLGMIALVSLVGCDNSVEEPKNNQEQQQQQQPQEETYTVKFMNGDVVLQEGKYHEGDLPSYTGEKPTKPADADGYYEFAGWDKRITLVSGDTTYNAQFKKTEYANRFVDLQEVYYPYNDNIKQYLSDEEPNVALYNGNTVGVSPIKIKFESNYPNTTGLKFYYDTREDFSTASVFDLQPTVSEVQLYNLLKDQVYYIKLTSIIGDEEKNPIVDSFKTTDLGPRVLKVGGIDNVRDLGGYQTGSTKTLQGMLFRGSEMQGSHGLELNAEGQKVLSEDIGIKLDIDLRGTDEALGITESPINGAAYKRYSITNYAGVFTSSSTKSLLRQLFGDLANENNYPAYIHCYGGADRTGTLCYLINALCGVSDIDLIHDYEYTTFSRFGERNSKTYANNQKMPDFLTELAKLPGETTQEKVRGYLLSCGVSENELNIINAIMHGEEIPTSVTCPEEYSSQLLNKLTLSISGGVADKVQINGKEVQFNPISTGVEIPASELNTLPEGEITGKVILTNKKELSFSFMNKVLDVVDVEDLATIEGVLKITQKTTLPGVVGYDKYVRAHLKTEADSTGGTQMFIGSYGFVLRGGRLRLENMNSNGTISNKQKGETADVKMFNAGDLDVLLKVNVEDTKVGYDFYTTNGTTYQHIVHEEADLKLTSGEIPATEAKVTFNVNSNCPVIYVIPREASFASNISFNLDEETNILIPASKPELVTKIVINEKEVEFSTEEFALVINKNAVDGINDASELSGNIYVGETAHPFHVTIIKTILSVEEKVTYTIGEESVSIGFNVPGLVTKVTLDDAEVSFTTDDSHIIIAKSQLGEVKNGQVINGKITAKGQTLSFVINVIEHVNFVSGTCTVNSSNKTYTGTTAVGYNGTKLKLNLTTTTSGSGDFFLLIGSYGFQLRGGSMRTAKKSSTDANATEFSPRTELKPEGVATNMFDKGGVIEMSLTIKDATTITLTISYVLKDGKTASVSKDLTRLTSNEIPAENSYVYAQVTSCAATFSQAN